MARRVAVVQMCESFQAMDVSVTRAPESWPPESWPPEAVTSHR